jgi:hypothetical protein
MFRRRGVKHRKLLTSYRSESLSSEVSGGSLPEMPQQHFLSVTWLPFPGYITPGTSLQSQGPKTCLFSFTVSALVMRPQSQRHESCGLVDVTQSRCS